MPWYPALRTVPGWFICCTIVRRGRVCVGVVEALSLDVQPFSRKEVCLLEGLVPCNVLLARALTLGVSRGILIGRSDPLPAICHALAYSVGKAAKRTTGRVPVPYHASRD